MDINGAKALKKRLSLNGAGGPAPAKPSVVPADAAPVYRWTGKTPPEAVSPEAADEVPRRPSLFRRLSFSLR